MPKYTNNDMDGMVAALEPLLERRDRIGYAAARNTRLLNESLTEYHKLRDELVLKYGEAETDDAGNMTDQVSISPTSPRWPEFLDEISRYATIAHDVDLFTIKYDEAIGVLSGSEMLACDWMFED